MFNLRFNVSVTLFVLITALWANYYLKHLPVQAPASPKIASADTLILFDKSHPLAFHPLVATGEHSPDGNGEIFAQIKDHQGKVMNAPESNDPYICHNNAGPDHTSLLQKEGQLFAITHLECSVGGAYISKLTQDKQGLLNLDSFKWIDFSAVGGTAVGCAGVTTPWQTHLGSEEYENEMSTATAFNYTIAGAHSYLGIKATPASVQKLGYHQGWITEITPTDTQGSTKVEKHYAMGRFSHELAYVMPDEKTVYLSDDGSNGAFFMFIADEKRNFDAGTLYAAKWHQNKQIQKATDTVATLSWISLGHADQLSLKEYLDQSPSFDDLFEKRAYKEGCQDGFKAVNTASTGPECLKLKKGKEHLASRLESRRYAALLGATTEFKKSEGITYNAKENALYLSISVASSGMEDHANKGKHDDSYDRATANDIRLPYNPCGMILKMELSQNEPLHSALVATQVSTLIQGSAKYYQRPDQLQYNSCDVTTIANPDNISMLPNSPYLAIAEDSKGHEIDRIWLLNTLTHKLQEIAKAPLGAEFTSTYWHKDINGFSYLMSVIQHPYGEKDALIDHTKDKVDPKEKQSVIGYFGPFVF